ncbi:MAG: hypothetical protein QOD01_718 [Actinomycetota bacterium]|jgi:transposase|nr:hypothetical protein [Actinomycetota bacterium]
MACIRAIPPSVRWYGSRLVVADRWYVCFGCEVPRQVTSTAPTASAVGVDVG